MHHGGKSLKEDPDQSEPANAELRLDHCLDSVLSSQCSVCESGFIILNGRCVDSCPAEGYYTGQQNRQESCIQCYYSCKTCNGPNDYQVRQCKQTAVTFQKCQQTAASFKNVNNQLSF